MNRKKLWVWDLVLLGLLATLFLISCGVEVAEAPRVSVEALELRTFPKENWRLTNNKFFLWGEDMTAQHVSRARKLGNEIDELDSQALPLNRKHLDLEVLIDPLKDSIRLLSKHLRPIKRVVGKAEKKKKGIEKKLLKANEELQTEKTKPEPDPSVVSELTLEVAELEAQQAALEDSVVELVPVRDDLEQEIDGYKELLEPLEAEMETLEVEQLEIELAGRERVDELMTFVDWYKDQPSSVVFQFEEDGSITASISGWNLNDDAGARNFSTKAKINGKPTMGNVTYTELGGVFRFEVYVYEDDAQNNLRETYTFRVGRINYDAADGRKFFGGEITRTREVNGTTETRRGIAKLVDRNN